MATIIVAYDEDRAIAKDGKIPWHIPEDLKHFKETTLNRAIIMGRKTWDSLPLKFRPLPNRMNIVLTRQHHEVPLFYDPAEPYWASSFEDAFRQAVQIHGGKEVFIHCEEFPLSGSGFISLGASVSVDNEHMIYFSCQ